MTDLSIAAKGKSGQNRENLRQHNLSLVLRLLHQMGTVARSQLTSVTGLNRSTISDLVAELAARGLVVESEAVLVGGVGRPSLTVGTATNVVAFAVNPEIDATTVAAVTLDGKLIDRVRYPTHIQPEPQKAAQIANQLVTSMRNQLPAGTRIAGIGAAVPGQVRVNDGVVRFAPHLNWIEAPFGPMLSQLTGLPVLVDNDASLATLAERTYGSAKGARHVVSLFAGSGGIGGGVIVDGQQLRGATGYAGELGHMQISNSPELDFSGLPGTLEALVRRDDLLEVFKLDAATDEELHFEILKAKDAGPVKVIQNQIEALGRGVGVLATIFNPQMVVLSGFLASLFQFDSDRLLEVIRLSTLQSAHDSLLVRTGELGTRAVLVGAAELAFSNLLDNPAAAPLIAANNK
jgi:predicted NBD/HSP70 family sugar kinase